MDSRLEGKQEACVFCYKICLISRQQGRLPVQHRHLRHLRHRQPLRLVNDDMRRCHCLLLQVHQPARPRTCHSMSRFLLPSLLSVRYRTPILLFFTNIRFLSCVGNRLRHRPDPSLGHRRVSAEEEEAGVETREVGCFMRESRPASLNTSMYNTLNGFFSCLLDIPYMYSAALIPYFFPRSRALHSLLVCSIDYTSVFSTPSCRSMPYRFFPSPFVRDRPSNIIARTSPRSYLRLTRLTG